MKGFINDSEAIEKFLFDQRQPLRVIFKVFF